MTKVPKCPNLECKFSTRPKTKFYQKKGYYQTKWNHQPVPRYRCKACKKYFSSHTFRSNYQQKKPYLNRKIYELYCSAVTQRRIALILGINRKTVVRKFLYLAQLAREEHLRFLELGKLQINAVQFDEMLSFEHTRLKPVSIALAVEAAQGKIIEVRVAQSHYQGRLSSIALAKYGPRPDQSQLARFEVLKTLARVSGNKNLEITTDAKPQYENEIAELLPKANLQQVVNRGNRLSRLLQARRRNEQDKLFFLNLAAARIRHDLSRMGRKVWVTTKKMERLELHLFLFVAFHNGYCFV